jgi:hypothetical protein
VRELPKPNVHLRRPADAARGTVADGPPALSR